MRFEFATAGRILFGEGRATEVGEIAAGFGRRALVVQGRRDHARACIDSLREMGMVAAEFRAAGEPRVADAVEAVRVARDGGCDVVVGIGGGSAIDLAKAAAALLTNPGPPIRYLEVVGDGAPLEVPPAPCIALPTTAGTGAEVTRNAVLGVPEEGVKVSLRSPLMLPRVAIVDPVLTHSMPPAVTASTGLDALTQCIEPFVGAEANPLSDGIAREGIRAAAEWLRAAYHTGDREARVGMSMAGLCGGLALANARLGAVHGMAGPLGGLLPVPHGVACGRLLAPVMETNIRALRDRAPGAPALSRYAEVARLLTGRPEARPEEGVGWVRALVEELRLPSLRDCGLDDRVAEDVVRRAQRASSMRGNPLPLSDAEIAEILHSAG